MADSRSRSWQDADSDALATESEDMDFQLATEEEGDNANDADFFEHLITGEGRSDMGGIHFHLY